MIESEPIEEHPAAQPDDENAPPVVLFREDQRFRQFWLWFILVSASAVIVGTVLWMMVRQLYHGLPFAPDHLSDTTLLVLGLIVVGFTAGYLLLFAATRLQVEVTSAGIFLRYFPRQRRVRMIALDDLTRVEAVGFRPYLEYGGYGFRRHKWSRSYIVEGTEGVRLWYANGYHLLIGSQAPDALGDAIRRMLEARGISAETPEPLPDDAVDADGDARDADEQP